MVISDGLLARSRLVFGSHNSPAQFTLLSFDFLLEVFAGLVSFHVVSFELVKLRLNFSDFVSILKCVVGNPY